MLGPIEKSLAIALVVAICLSVAATVAALVRHFRTGTLKQMPIFLGTCVLISCLYSLGLSIGVVRIVLGSPFPVLATPFIVLFAAAAPVSYGLAARRRWARHAAVGFWLVWAGVYLISSLASVAFGGVGVAQLVAALSFLI